MSTLYEGLETEVEIKDTIYEVNISFDNIVLLLEMLNDAKLSDVEKVYYGIYRLLGTELELDLDKQIKIFEVLIEKFIHAGEKQEAPVDLEGNAMPAMEQKQNYSLMHDATYIFTSFKKAYGMDLFEERGKLDWRKFKELLRDLPDDTKFKQVVDIRTRPYPKGKHSAEERKKLKELKRAFALPGFEVE